MKKITNKDKIGTRVIEDNRILKEFIASNNKVFVNCCNHGETFGVIVGLGINFVAYACSICFAKKEGIIE